MFSDHVYFKDMMKEVEIYIHTIKYTYWLSDCRETSKNHCTVCTYTWMTAYTVEGILKNSLVLDKQSFVTNFDSPIPYDKATYSYRNGHYQDMYD